jgi:hypothetical protein
LVAESKEIIFPQILFLLQYKLLRELPVDIVVKQNSTLQLYGNVVLMEN